MHVQETSNLSLPSMVSSVPLFIMGILDHFCEVIELISGLMSWVAAVGVQPVRPKNLLGVIILQNQVRIGKLKVFIFENVKAFIFGNVKTFILEKRKTFALGKT